MDRYSSCQTCSDRLVCHCLQVTENEVIETLATRDIQTIKDIRNCTGAGDGCTACHDRLRQLIQKHRVSLEVCVAG